MGRSCRGVINAELEVERGRIIPRAATWRMFGNWSGRPTPSGTIARSIELAASTSFRLSSDGCARRELEHQAALAGLGRDPSGEDLAVRLRVHQHTKPVGGLAAEVEELARP